MSNFAHCCSPVASRGHIFGRMKKIQSPRDDVMWHRSTHSTLKSTDPFCLWSFWSKGGLWGGGAFEHPALSIQPIVSNSILVSSDLNCTYSVMSLVRILNRPHNPKYPGIFVTRKLCFYGSKCYLAAFIRMSEAPPPALYPCLIISPWLAVVNIANAT